MGSEAIAAAPVRFGILGTGWIVPKYIEASRLLPGLEVVAVASRDEARARATAARWGVARGYGGYERLLADADVEVVINALHNGLHCLWTVRALEAGKHVLCEKPLGRDAGEVAQMVAAAQQSGRHLMEAFMYRFHPQMDQVRQRLRAGEIGELLHVHCWRMSRGREAGNLRYDAAAGGGALLDLGCYCVDFARWMIGAEPVRVRSSVRRRGGVDMTTSGMLEFGGGVTAQFCCSFEAEPAYSAELIGTEGRMVIPHPWMPPVWPTEFVVYRRQVSEVVRVEPAGLPGHVWVNFARELAHFAACVRGAATPAISGQDSLGNARVLDAVRAAWEP
jgi:predicted dehydrogenase